MSIREELHIGKSNGGGKAGGRCGDGKT